MGIKFFLIDSDPFVVSKIVGGKSGKSMVESNETNLHHRHWMSSEESSNEFLIEEINTFLMSENVVNNEMLLKIQNQSLKRISSDNNLNNLAANAISAAGAAILSAVIVNPLDVAKVCFFLFLSPEVSFNEMGTFVLYDFK